MALPKYKIAEYEFLTLVGPPNTAHPRSEVITRPGLPGGEIWRTRRQPVPFTMVSVVDTRDTEHSHQLYRDYQRLAKRETLLQVTYRDVLSSAFLTSYYVLDVNVLEMREIANLCGKAINPPSLGLLTCEWLLAPFDDVVD